MSDNTVVIVNPQAGGGRALRVWRGLGPVFAEHFPDHQVWLSERPGDATDLARRAVAETGAVRVVAVGGDGTIHEVVNGMAGSGVPLGVLPFGTGNDFARALRLPKQPQAALDVVRSGVMRTLDLGRVNGQYYVQVAGTGFDATVAQRVNERGRAGTGTVPYLMSVFATLRSYRNLPLELKAERECSGPALMLAVGNTSFYAGGMRVCPGADPTDGVLDWCWVGDMSKLQTLGALVRVFSGTHVKLPKVTTGRAAEIRVDGPSSLPVHADGEMVGHLPAHFECVPGALTVMVPSAT